MTLRPTEVQYSGGLPGGGGTALRTGGTLARGTGGGDGEEPGERREGDRDDAQGRAHDPGKDRSDPRRGRVQRRATDQAHGVSRTLRHPCRACRAAGGAVKQGPPGWIQGGAHSHSQQAD